MINKMIQDKGRIVCGELRLAGAGRDGVQPDSGRWLLRLQLPRPRDHRHDPRPADQRLDRLAHSARKQILHLPERWPWQQAWQQLFDLTMGAPPRLATP